MAFGLPFRGSHLVSMQLDSVTTWQHPNISAAWFLYSDTDSQVILTAMAVAASEGQNTEELRWTVNRLGNETEGLQHSLQLCTVV